MEYVKLSENLKFVNVSIFFNTPKLKSIILPDSIEMIATFAFSKSGIESIKIPKNVSFIMNYTFRTSNITSIEFEEGSILNTIG